MDEHLRSMLSLEENLLNSTDSKTGIVIVQVLHHGYFQRKCVSVRDVLCTAKLALHLEDRYSDLPFQLHFAQVCDRRTRTLNLF